MTPAGREWAKALARRDMLRHHAAEAHTEEQRQAAAKMLKEMDHAPSHPAVNDA